jgi:hypothetical protein
MRSPSQVNIFNPRMPAELGKVTLKSNAGEELNNDFFLTW